MLNDRRATLVSYALILLAVLIQIQATIELDASKLRANAADIALAVFSPVILIALYTYRARLREIAGTHMLVLAASATLILSFSMFRGYESISALSIWAAIKYVGWYILLFYLALGMLIAIVAGPEGKERFALGLVFFQFAVVIAFIAIIFLGYSGSFHNWSFIVNGRLTGFSGNTNAMAFFLICGFALALAYFGRSALSPRLRRVLLVSAASLFAGILFTKSIAALIALIVVIFFAAIIHVVTLKRLLQVVVVGITLWLTPQVISQSKSLLINILHKLFGIILSGSDANPFLYARYESTVAVRIEGYLEAFAMWQAYPFFGAGLGVHLHGQSLGDKSEAFILQIHNTALWLLAETGLAGFCAMAGIFIVIFHKVWCLSHSKSGKHGEEAWFQSAVLLILVGWAVMSLFHELMYQRIFWLLAGMALSAPVRPLRYWKWGPVNAGADRK